MGCPAGPVPFTVAGYVDPPAKLLNDLDDFLEVVRSVVRRGEAIPSAALHIRDPCYTQSCGMLLHLSQHANVALNMQHKGLFEDSFREDLHENVVGLGLVTSFSAADGG